MSPSALGLCQASADAVTTPVVVSYVHPCEVWVAAMAELTVRAARGTMVTRVVLGAVVAGVLVVRQVNMGVSP